MVSNRMTLLLQSMPSRVGDTETSVCTRVKDVYTFDMMHTSFASYCKEGQVGATVAREIGDGSVDRVKAVTYLAPVPQASDRPDTIRLWSRSRQHMTHRRRPPDYLRPCDYGTVPILLQNIDNIRREIIVFPLVHLLTCIRTPPCYCLSPSLVKFLPLDSLGFELNPRQL